MPIRQTVKGNLLSMFKEGRFDGIAHGCNCCHTMGAGIAAGVSSEFPEALEADIKHHIAGANVTGQYSAAEVAHGIIFNLYTQLLPGREDSVKLNKNIEAAFQELNDDLKELAEKIEGWSETPHIGIPMIGAGIAGGNWQHISRLINKATPDINITLVEYQP